MKELEDVLAILRNEYGIDTYADLLKAIEKIGPIDITPFCADPQIYEKESTRNNERKHGEISAVAT